MKIVMTIMVRNEEDIIGENLEYHLYNGVDHFIITDHHSTDGTMDILREYERKGVAEVRVEQSEEHHQAQWVTEMARLALSRYDASWVINNDADEFWIPQKGNLKDFFHTIPQETYKIHVSRFDFFYKFSKDLKFYDAMLFREFQRRWTKCCHRALPDISVEVGNHDANSESMNQQGFGSSGTIDLIVFHYPIRTVERFKKKMIEGTASVLQTPGIPPDTFFHWKKALQYIHENRFDEYLSEYSRSLDQINDGIRNWMIVYDDTLQRFFHKI